MVQSQCVARDLDPGPSSASGSRGPPRVDLERFRPARLRPGSSAGRLVLGAIVDWKRPDLALEAVALAARELPELV